MNSNPFQSWLLIFNTGLGAVAALLMQMGCTEIVDKISCTASTAPTWLVPYLVYTAVAVNVGKIALAVLTGKVFTKTVVMADRPKVGQVSTNSVVY